MRRVRVPVCLIAILLTVTATADADASTDMVAPFAGAYVGPLVLRECDSDLADCFADEAPPEISATTGAFSLEAESAVDADPDARGRPTARIARTIVFELGTFVVAGTLSGTAEISTDVALFASGAGTPRERNRATLGARASCRGERGRCRVSGDDASISVQARGGQASIEGPQGLGVAFTVRAGRGCRRPAAVALELHVTIEAASFGPGETLASVDGVLERVRLSGASC